MGAERRQEAVHKPAKETHQDPSQEVSTTIEVSETTINQNTTVIITNVNVKNATNITNGTVEYYVIDCANCTRYDSQTPGTLICNNTCTTRPIDRNSHHSPTAWQMVTIIALLVTLVTLGSCCGTWIFVDEIKLRRARQKKRAERAAPKVIER